MKKKIELEYNSKEELIAMIVWLFHSSPNYIAKQRMMEFLISNYKHINLGSLQTLKDMPYDELEEMYVAMKFVSNK